MLWFKCFTSHTYSFFVKTNYLSCQKKIILWNVNTALDNNTNCNNLFKCFITLSFCFKNNSMLFYNPTFQPEITLKTAPSILQRIWGLPWGVYEVCHLKQGHGLLQPHTPMHLLNLGWAKYPSIENGVKNPVHTLGINTASAASVPINYPSHTIVTHIQRA